MTRSRAALLLEVLLLAVPASACDSNAPREERAPGAASSGDSQVVVAADRGLWSASPQLVQELRIGRLEGDDRYQFGSVAGLAVGGDGTIFVVDEQGPRLRMYDADGRFVREIGRVGSGPGEYRHITGLAVTPAGELAIYDTNLRRVSFFGSSGEFLRSFDSQVGGYWRRNSFHQDSAGNFFIFGRRPSPTAPVITGPDGTSIGSEGPGHQISFYLKLSPKGEILDTLAVPESTAPREPGFFLMTKEGDFSSFAKELVYDLTPSGHFVTGYTTERYRVDIETVEGKVLRVERRYEPVRLGREERAQWEAVADHITRNRGGISAGTRIPEVKPAFRDLDVAEDGRIWVHRYAEATERLLPPRPPERGPGIAWRDIPTFDVFEPGGAFLGTVLPPIDTRFLVRRGDRLWGVYRGELDESYIVRYRMEIAG